MSDEIYINIGTTIQQPYQGQTPASAQSLETKQKVERKSVNSQSLYQSPSQSPQIYRNPTNAQTTISAQESNPFTFQAQQQITFQSPYQSPSITQSNQPSRSSYNVQSEYQSEFQSSYDVQTDTQSSYNVQSSYQSNIDVQNPFTYQNPYTSQFQDIGPVNLQSPIIVISGEYKYDFAPPAAPRSPIIYWYQTNLVKAIEPDELYAYQGPRGDGYDMPGNKQVANPYRSPFTGQGAIIQANKQTTIAGTPAGPANMQTTVEFQIPYNSEPVVYQMPSIYYSTGTQPYQSPSIYTAFVSQNPVISDVRQPLPARQPTIGQTTVRQPLIARQPVRQPSIAQQPVRQPVRQPLIAQQPSIVQADTDTQNDIQANAQQPSPYIASAQTQSPYFTQQPSTYRNPTNRQVATQNDTRQPNIYQVPYQVPYSHRSPFIYQTPYSTTRTIGPVAKVKAIYLNSDGQTIEKLDEVYVNNQGTADKIHQTVPAARFSKNPSNTQQ